MTVIPHKHGADISVHLTEKQQTEYIQHWVWEYWGEAFGNEPPLFPPDVTEEMISDYFDNHPDEFLDVRAEVWL